MLLLLRLLSFANHLIGPIVGFLFPSKEEVNLQSNGKIHKEGDAVPALLCPASQAVFIRTVVLLSLLLLIKTYLPLWRKGLFTLPTIGPTQSITQENQ